jgi:hypothetical protein
VGVVAAIMTSWNVTLRLPDTPPWYLITDCEQLIKRWEHAFRQNRFFHIRYAGVDYYVNPRQIMYVDGRIDHQQRPTQSA